jgi:hypothetical protein
MKSLKLSGQGCKCTANMAGAYFETQGKLFGKCPQIKYIYYASHNLNVVRNFSFM